METVVKCIKQHSFEIENIDELKLIVSRYVTVKNYVYSRYSGINSLLILSEAKKEIRDVWVKTKFAEQWKLPARYWKMALDEAIANIKTEWANIRLRIKSATLKNENLTDDEKFFVLYAIKADSLLFNILKHKAIERPEKIKDLLVREQYIYNLIRRYVRKYKGKVPYSRNSRSFMIDANMYKYMQYEDGLRIEIMGLERGRRISVKLKDNNMHKGNLRIVLYDNTLEIHRSKQVRAVKSWSQEKVIGLDKGYRTLIATSEGKFYGEKLNDLLSKETERRNKVNAKRNRLYALYEKHLSEGKTKKAENILSCNLGKIKYNRCKNKHSSIVKGYINHELDRFFEDDNPSEVVTEDLSFASWDDRYPKHVRRKLSRWIKGYIRERLDYKASLLQIKTTKVNAAYTSQTCSICGEFGKRDGDVFTCSKCGKLHADGNAAVNIKNRKYDKEIALYTPYKRVKKILEDRLKTA